MLSQKSDKLAWISEVTTEVLARVHRRSVRVSPYKKNMNKTASLAMKVLKDPSDTVIRQWASHALSAQLGSRALNLTDKNVNDIRGVALLLTEIAEYSPQQISVFLSDAATYSANNADDQLQKLIAGLNSAEDKKKISTKQMTHDRIGNPLLLDMNSNSENFQKPIDTRRGLI